MTRQKQSWSAMSCKPFCASFLRGRLTNLWAPGCQPFWRTRLMFRSGRISFLQLSAQLRHPEVPQSRSVTVSRYCNHCGKKIGKLCCGPEQDWPSRLVQSCKSCCPALTKAVQTFSEGCQSTYHHPQPIWTCSLTGRWRNAGCQSGSVDPGVGVCGSHRYI